MNAVETLEAAITKLERIKSDSFPGPWAHWPEAGDIEIMNESFSHVVVSKVRPRDGWRGPIYRENYEPNAELIVTLHRTIDAQLAILRDSYLIASSLPPSVAFPSTNTPDIRALALARAILGDS
ncbi:hypothetical protein [Agromyces lapidis]|uniref:Uncharacterized protein n=1 Tax=Agromyces lapidis TaxID=279574 RepID=A0ABV5SME7_9MICO|nr:hypothetical protein [Agromyces lapidis]